MQLKHAILAIIVAGLLAASAGQARAENLVCEGVLGNSGAQGDDLVRFGEKPSNGMGLAMDSYGTLWDRAGEGVLNRYSVDGRLLAQYKIPQGTDRTRDKVIVVGDVVVLQIRGRLYSLLVDAPSGTEASSMNRSSGNISFGTVDGKFASAADGKLLLIDPKANEVEEVGTVDGTNWLEMGPDGAIYSVIDWKLHKFVDGRAMTDGWPRGVPGERPQFIDGYWYGHTWHGTIRRYDSSLSPDPGVVLGGSSGSFIGNLPENTDVVNGRGLVKIRDGLFAVSGFSGVASLLEWNGEKRQMQVIRRIGSIPHCRGVAIDGDGTVWFNGGTWQWNDAPDAPLELCIPYPSPAGQTVTLENNSVVIPMHRWGKPNFVHGKLTELLRGRGAEGSGLPETYAGAATYQQGGQQILLVVEEDGTPYAYRIGRDGAWYGNADPVTLKTQGDAKQWTSLATNGDKLLAAIDGNVVEFNRDGSTWTEARRWQLWGRNSAAHFGKRIYIAADAGRLWVADCERHRVCVFSLADGDAIASFGTGMPGTDMNSLDTPETIAVRGHRAVVYDSANQRLVKLSIR